MEVKFLACGKEECCVAAVIKTCGTFRIQTMFLIDMIGALLLCDP